MFTTDQKRIAYANLSQSAKDFIMSPETTESIIEILKSTDLNQEQSNLADTQILDTLFGLQSPQMCIKNISKVCNKSPESLFKLQQKLNDEIFNQVATELKSAWENQTTDAEEKPLNNIGNSFEQIILNQAKAMQPAREAGSGGEQTVSSGQVESNVQQQAENIQKKPTMQVPNYTNGDPYREPLE